MGEFRRKRVNHNQEVLSLLVEKHSVGHDFVRKSIRGDRTGTLSKIIKEEYDLMAKASTELILTMSNLNVKNMNRLIQKKSEEV